jgi:predicted anti-sigma-YlaC factor YlaD
MAHTAGCQRSVEVVTDYLEDVMAARARERFEHHLRACATCRTYVDEMRTTITLVRRVAAFAPSADVRATLLALFREQASR